MRTPKFAHEDLIKVVPTGQVGTVTEVHRIGEGYRYGVRLRTNPPRYVQLPEAELELIKLAHADETGLHIRYIT